MPLRFFAIVDSVIGAVGAVLVTSPGRLLIAVGRGALRLSEKFGRVYSDRQNCC
jgi:hypothetical protein